LKTHIGDVFTKKGKQDIHQHGKVMVGF